MEAYQKAIALFEGAGALAKAAQTSITLAMDQAWHIEHTAADRTIGRALERLGSGDPEFQMSLLILRACVMSDLGDACGAARLLADIEARRYTIPGLVEAIVAHERIKH